MAAIELFPDQQEALGRVLERYHACPQGGKALIVAPTAWGKTIFFSSLIHSLSGVEPVLIIGHREELLEQAREKYHLFDPTAIVGKVGSGTYEWGAPITVAGIDTISRPNHCKNLYRFGYRLVIWDEAHHCRAPKYEVVRDVLPDAFHLGVTATPDRLDNKSIEPLFDKPVFSMDIKTAIACKRLSDIRAIAIRTETNLDDISSRKNSDGDLDFNQQELAGAVDNPERNQCVVEAYQKHAAGRRAICFGVSVNHAENLAAAFLRAGVPSAVVSGNTTKEERTQLYARLRTGELKVLCNVLVLTEGFDLPQIDCVIMARPTQSRALYTQCLGRGLRLAPGKKDCIVLDLTDNSFRLRLQPQNIRKAVDIHLKDEELLTSALAREEEEREEREEREKQALVRKLNERRTSDQEINLFALPEWQEKPDGKFVMSVGVGNHHKHRIALVPVPSMPGFYAVYARLAPNLHIAQQWLGGSPLDYAVQYAEKRARMLLEAPTSTVLVDKDAPWRRLPASEGQIKFLKWRKIAYPEELTKGQAADLIDACKLADEQKKATQAARKAEQEAREQKNDEQLKRDAMPINGNRGFQLMR